MTQGEIDDIKKMTMMTRKLSDWHSKNFKHFIAIALDNLDLSKTEIEYDLGDPALADPGFVTYKITRKGRKKLAANKEQLQKRLEALSTWTKSILWNDLKVDVMEKGKSLIKAAK
jgi:hypothetical protein